MKLSKSTAVNSMEWMDEFPFSKAKYMKQDQSLQKHKGLVKSDIIIINTKDSLH